jgi:hypothetical protein
MPLTHGSGSCYFHHRPTRRQQKVIFLTKFFCLFLFEGTFTAFLKDKKSKRSQKTVGIKVFFLFLLDDRKSRIWICTGYLWLTTPDPGGPKTYGSDGSGSATLLLRKADVN